MAGKRLWKPITILRSGRPCMGRWTTSSSAIRLTTGIGGRSRCWAQGCTGVSDPIRELREWPRIRKARRSIEHSPPREPRAKTVRTTRLLEGDTTELPNAPVVYKGCTTVVRRLYDGCTRDQHARN